MSENIKLPVHVGTVYTMEALVPGGSPRLHASLSEGLDAGTKLYTADQLRAAVLADREGRQQCDTPAKGEYWLVQTPRAQALWHVEVLEVLSHSIRLKGRHSYYDMDGAWYAISDLRFVQLTTDAQRAKGDSNG